MNDDILKKIGNLGSTFSNDFINKIDLKPQINYDFLDPNRKKYHSPSEIIEENEPEFERPDFSESKCLICNELVEQGYFWYYLRHKIYTEKSKVLCSQECLKEYVDNHDCTNYEIFEYSRCSAYYKCKEIGNLRNMCEHVENKSYRSIIPFVNKIHCEPAQAGLILSTHKFTNILEDYSQQTKQQFISNKEMMTNSAKESRKQFWITTFMTVLVIILTVINIIPTFSNREEEVIKKLENIEIALMETDSSIELDSISDKLTELELIISERDSNQLHVEVAEIKELLNSIDDLLKKYKEDTAE